MKLKEFLTQKVNKDTFKQNTVQRAIKLTICGAFIVSLIFQLVGCLFAPISASAYYNEDSQTAQVIVVDELPTTDIDDNAVYMISGSDEEDSIVGTWVFNDTISSSDVYKMYNIEFSSYAIFVGEPYTEFIGINCYTMISLDPAPTDVPGYSVYNTRTQTVMNSWNKNITITGGTDINDPAFITWLKANAVKQVDSGSGSTVTTYYVHYNDTWFDTDNISTAVTFLNYRVNNPSIVNTLDVLLDDYSGSFDSIVDMLNSRNYQEYEDFVRGKEQKAFDRGASSGFGENVLGSAFNAPLTALNQWVLFETSTGLEVTMGGVFTGLIALSILIILLKMFSGG